MQDIRDFIPDTTLERWTSYREGRKSPKEPEHLEVACDEKECKISYTMTINPKVGSPYRRAVSVSVPRLLEYDANFQAAVVAYLCEGDHPRRANGVRIGLNNSDWRIIRLVVDEFEKLGLKRERWDVRLELYEGIHDESSEKKWWSEKLRIPLSCFTTPTWFEGTKGKEEFSPHGRARVQRSSTIFAAIIDSTCEKVMRDLLGS
jgi:hypothetical protein